MHKNGKWATQILELQDAEGKWGCFHSLAGSYGAPMTTEQALRRLQRLGYTIEDACIQRVVDYMNACLIGEKEIPDPREKAHNWDIFVSLMLSTWIRRFTKDNPAANRVAKQWAEILSAAFQSGEYSREAYVNAYHDVLKMKPGGGRLIDFVNFYPVSLVQGCLDEKTEKAMVAYVLNHEGGIYYIYENKLCTPPLVFASREASRYLAAIELLAPYHHAGTQLAFVVDWLEENRNENGKWDMGKTANDKVYFPLSDDWRRRETRENDCTERIEKLLEELRNWTGGF